MEPRDNSKYIATPARVFMTIIVMLTAVLILQAIGIEVAHLLLRPERESPTKQPKKELTDEEKRLERIRYSTKECLPDGTIHLVHQPGRRFYFEWEESGKQQIYDTNDNLLWEGIAKDSPYKYLSWAQYTYDQNFKVQDMRQIQMITPELSQTLEIPVRLQGKTAETWRYIPGRDCFTGYEARGGKIGYAGATGFVDSKSEAQPFGKFESFIAWCPEDSYSPTLLWQTSRRIYEINFEKQQVELIFESSEGDIKEVYIHTWGSFKTDTVERADAKGYRPLLQCITKDRKDHLIMRDPAQQLTVKPPEDWNKWCGNYVRFTAAEQGIFLHRRWVEFRKPPDYSQERQLAEQWQRDYQAKPKKNHAELYKVDEQGDIELLNRYAWTVPGEKRDRPQWLYVWETIQYGVKQVSPPLYDFVWYVYLRSVEWPYDWRRRNTVAGETLIGIDQFRPGLSVWNWIIGALMAGLACLHAWPRRTSWARFVFWLVFVWLFNLAGLLTYLALNHTPVIECSVCGKRRGLAQVCCVRCQTELPAPRQRELDLIVDA